MAEVVRLTVEEGVQDLVPDQDLHDRDHVHLHTVDSHRLQGVLLLLLGGCHHDDLHQDKEHHPLAGHFLKGQVRGHLKGHHHQEDDTGKFALFGPIA